MSLYEGFVTAVLFFMFLEKDVMKFNKFTVKVLAAGSLDYL